MIKKDSEVIDQLMDLQKNGMPQGSKINLAPFDDQLTFVKGGCTDITGYPFYGKSLVFKEILMSLSMNSGWRHCVYLPDDGSDIEVLSNLMHKLTGKTFSPEYPNAITERDISKHSKTLLNSFKFISSEHSIEPKAFWNYAKEQGCNSACIDSWNYMAHEGEPISPDYLRKILSYRNRFFDSNKMHSFIIIHPKNPDRKQVTDGMVSKPTVYDLMGGSEWNNNGKNIIVVHKNTKQNHEPYTIHVDKVKPKFYGKLGNFQIHMDWATQRFYEYDPVYNIKKYAYSNEQQVDSVMKPITIKKDEPF